MLTSTHFDTLLFTLGVAVIYLLIVRFLDMNEKEPLWAIGMLFVLGAGAALVLRLLVSSTLLELTVLEAAAARETARFFAVSAGLGVLALIGQSRGWSEVDGVMDGLVYGASAGLGFATGEVLAHDLLFRVDLPGFQPALAVSVGSAALTGLAGGIFGAVIGGALAAALHTRSALGRALLPVIGFAGALGCDAGHRVLSREDALGGTQGVIRSWVGLLLPALLVFVVGILAIRKEKRAIRDELREEASSGLVGDDDIELLSSTIRRQIVYLKALASGRFLRLMRLRALHNREVQLALAKQRVGTEPSARSEVKKLRAAVLELKRAERAEAR